MEQRFIVIGLDDNQEPFFAPQVMEEIKAGRVFSGGLRHKDIVSHLLPEGAEWILVTAPIDAVFKRYEEVFQDLADNVRTSSEGRTVVSSSHSHSPAIVVFASGDPLFFGLANTIRRKMPNARVQLYPAFNSLQVLAHRLVMRYDAMRTVSLTGRPWPELDRALIERAPQIGVLTDRKHTPTTIARRLLDYGYTLYHMYVGERLGHPERERIRRLSLTEAATSTFDMPNCLILRAELADGTPCALPPRPFGIPDSDFALLDGRTRMITKAPIRLLTLQTLGLGQRHVLWDVGFCTGSVAIEARLQFPHLQVVGFEVRPEGEALMRTNSRRFGAPGITAIIGDFLQMGFTADGDHTLLMSSLPGGHPLLLADDDRPTSPSCPAGSPPDTISLPRPDAVFIGGHGGRLEEMVERVGHVLAPSGCVVFNSVNAESQAAFARAVVAHGLTLLPTIHVTINDYHPIAIMKAERPRPEASTH